ncbi:MAG TPA: ATP-binding protein [Acidimicrobiales bacterium]|nr:ATP-binding protein [Acidimicrobiales bacterium]
MAGDGTSVRAARHLVAEALADGPPHLRDAAVLLAGELVTNAVVHGGGRFLLQIDVGSDRVRVEVTDSVALKPRLMEPTGDREHGRGMAIVDAFATEWGSDDLGSHKVVWFEICLER